MNISTPRAAPSIALPWIVHLRYFIAAGQMATVLLVQTAFGIHLPLGWISIPPILVALSNFWLSAHERRGGNGGKLAESTLIAGVFVLDTLCLTAVLMLSGGPNNPFTLLYLVHITLSATILTRRQTYLLGVLACCCFALLFWTYRPIPQLEMHHHGEGANLHLVGMWVGFAVATLLVTMFAGKISELLREREASLLRMQAELAKKDRLAALVTLAAGAAHELNTPLATIAVVAKELEHYAMRTVRNAAIADDSRLIRTEVERCRKILYRMSVDGAEPAGEALSDVGVKELIEDVVLSTAVFESLKVVWNTGVDALLLQVPRHAVEQALIALIKNAYEASADKSPVMLRVSSSDGAVHFEVQDLGIGMDEEALRHVGEPFFTTKDTGKGMGLGVFLVRTLADYLGGSLTVDSQLNVGTTAKLSLPLTPLTEMAR